MRSLLFGLCISAASLAAAPAVADLALVMFEQNGCPYCRHWDQDVAGKYALTTEGQAAPLRRVDIHQPLPDDLHLERPPNFTPTFVLVDNGVEVGRIEGYPGEAFFWGLLDGLIAEAELE